MSRAEKRRNRAQKSRLAELRRRKKLQRNIGRVILHTLAWSGVAVVYYIVVSLFVDTPYEIALKESSVMLRAEYERLNSRYDSLQMVMQSIEHRDRNIFGIMFDSEPHDISSKGDNTLPTLQENMYELDTEQLTLELERKSASLYQRLSTAQASIDTMVMQIENRDKERNYIPSIQPISNRQLTLLTASFGSRIHPFYKTLYQHNGVDYTIAEGTRVFATADGVIKEYTLSNSTSGKSIVIDHKNGYTTSYHHLSKIDIPRSRRVKRGDIIGMSGNTGLSLTPHLHYEIKYNGEYVDPIDYFFMELTPSSYQQLRRVAQSGMQAFD